MSQASGTAGSASHDLPAPLTNGGSGSSLKPVAVPARKKRLRRKLRATGRWRQSNSSGAWISASSSTSTVPGFVTGTRLYQLKGSEGNSIEAESPDDLTVGFFG